MPYEYRHARESDLQGVARVFAAAFPESVAHYFPSAPALSVVAEPFTLLLAAEPEAFYVADAGAGEVAGYIFAPSRTGRIPWVAVKGGFALRWLWRWISGRYGIGLAPVRALAANKVDFLTSARQRGMEAEARILSVAVSPDHQGQGVAGGICRVALERLDRLGASPVRLEVRPENAPAVKLYTRLGFTRRGSTRDSQGEWWIMLRDRPTPQ